MDGVAHAGQIAGRAVDGHAAHRARLGVGVGVGVGAEVLHGGGRERAGGIGVHELARGVDVAAEDLGDGIHAVLAGAADPQAGVDAVGGVVDPVERHGVGRVDEHHRGIEVEACDVFQKLLLFFLQFKIGIAVAELAEGEVAAFAAAAADGDDGQIVVAVIRDAGISHGIGGDLGDARQAGHRVELGEHAGRGAVHARVFQLLDALVVPVEHGLIDLEPCFRQRLAHGGGVGRIHLARARAAVNDIRRRAAEGGHADALGDGQGAVVHDQHAAFALDLLAQLYLPLRQLVVAVKIALVVFGIFVCVFVLDDDAGRDAQLFVDHTRV